MHRDSTREELFKHWLEDHRAIVFKTSYSFACSATEAAELQQEMQLQVWNSIPAFSEKSKASTWIYKVCLNSALAWRRGAERRESKIDAGVDLAGISFEGASPADTTAQQEILEKLYAAIRAMPDFERAIILLMLDGLAYREMAEITGLTETHVGVVLNRAKKRLATLMKGIVDELE